MQQNILKYSILVTKIIYVEICITLSGTPGTWREEINLVGRSAGNNETIFSRQK